MKAGLLYILLFVIFAILFVLPAVIFPFPLTSEAQPNVEPLKLLALLLVDFFSVIYLIKRLELKGVKLFMAVVLVFWGIQTLMTQIETWYFRGAMLAITDELMLKLFVNPLIAAVAFVPIAIRLMGKWKQAESVHNNPLDLKSKWKVFLGLSIAYVFIYFLFGYYVAWQFADVRTFYTGRPELLGFIDQFKYTMEIHPTLVPFQLLRGLLWIGCGLPIILYLKGSKTEKVLVCVFMYAVLTSIQLILDNPFMPATVRFAHLIEVSTSNAVFGLLIGLSLARRP